MPVFRRSCSGRVPLVVVCALLAVPLAESSALGQSRGGVRTSVTVGSTSPGKGGNCYPVPNGSFTPVLIPAPIILISPGGYFLPSAPSPGYGFNAGPGPMGPGGLMLPSPSAPAAEVPEAPAPRPPARRPAPGKRSELVTLGDRLFRAKNLKRAEERYLQAAKADPNSAAPYIRLALIELERGNYAEAADRLRTAQAAEPGWLVNAIDIQTVYAEPADFAGVITKLETYLQGHPNDRDAWLVLGAELFLSGRVERSRDVFLRLADRKLDDTVAAFLDASTPTQPAPPATRN